MNPEPNTTLQFRLHIDCENAAFEDAPQFEIARILRRVADRVECGDSDAFDTCQNLFDRNGNTVGQAALKTVDEHEGGRRHSPRGGAR